MLEDGRGSDGPMANDAVLSVTSQIISMKPANKPIISSASFYRLQNCFIVGYSHFLPITPGFIEDMDLGLREAVHSWNATILRCTVVLKCSVCYDTVFGTNRTKC